MYSPAAGIFDNYMDIKNRHGILMDPVCISREFFQELPRELCGFFKQNSRLPDFHDFSKISFNFSGFLYPFKIFMTFPGFPDLYEPCI